MQDMLSAINKMISVLGDVMKLLQQPKQGAITA